jgi:hypothetical protein
MKKKKHQNILVHIWGRLGNQMFQYAFGRLAQEKTGGKLTINFYNVDRMNQRYSNEGWADSLKFFNTKYDSISEFMLLHWYRYFSVSQVSLIIIRGLLGTNVLKNSKKKAYDELRGIEKKYADWYVKHSLFMYPNITAPFTVGKHRNAFLMSFYEDSALFDAIKPILVQEFTPREPVMQKNIAFYDRINTSQSICITIRRGDFLSEAFKEEFFICDESYFLKGIKIIKHKVKNPCFFFFSDDLGYAEEFAQIAMENDDEYYVESSGNPVWEKLRLMSACKHFIISNSTFSWWCQYLSKNDEKIVVGPKKWHKGDVSNQLVQEDWIKI